MDAITCTGRLYHWFAGKLWRVPSYWDAEGVRCAAKLTDLSGKRTERKMRMFCSLGLTGFPSAPSFFVTRHLGLESGKKEREEQWNK